MGCTRSIPNNISLVGWHLGQFFAPVQREQRRLCYLVQYFPFLHFPFVGLLFSFLFGLKMGYCWTGSKHVPLSPCHKLFYYALQDYRITVLCNPERRAHSCQVMPPHPRVVTWYCTGKTQKGSSLSFLPSRSITTLSLLILYRPSHLIEYLFALRWWYRTAPRRPDLRCRAYWLCGLINPSINGGGGWLYCTILYIRPKCTEYRSIGRFEEGPVSSQAVRNVALDIQRILLLIHYIQYAIRQADTVLSGKLL